MKKTIILTVIILSSISIKAQIKYGVQLHGLLNTASFTAEDDPSPEKDWKFGFGGGIFAEIPLASKLYLKPSINYHQKGVKATEYFYGEGDIKTIQKTRMNLNYIEVPVLLVYNLKSNSNKWYVGAGPSFGYGISGKAEVFQTIPESSQVQPGFFSVKAFKDVEDGGLGLKRFDFGINAMIGMRVLEKGSIQLGYLHGLSNVASKEYYSGDKYNNRSIMLTIGYLF